MGTSGFSKQCRTKQSMKWTNFSFSGRCSWSAAIQLLLDQSVNKDYTFHTWICIINCSLASQVWCVPLAFERPESLLPLTCRPTASFFATIVIDNLTVYSNGLSILCGTLLFFFIYWKLYNHFLPFLNVYPTSKRKHFISPSGYVYNLFFYVQTTLPY